MSAPAASRAAKCRRPSERQLRAPGNRVRYEVERLTGLRVAEVEVRIQDVRRFTA